MALVNVFRRVRMSSDRARFGESPWKQFHKTSTGRWNRAVLVKLKLAGVLEA